MTKTYPKKLSIDELIDSSQVFIIKRDTPSFEKVVITQNKSKDISAEYFQATIVEVLKAEPSRVIDEEFIIKTPPKSGLREIDPYKIKVGDKISIVSYDKISPDNPSPGKSYYVYSLEDPAPLDAKMMILFSGSYNSNLYAFSANFNYGLVDYKKLPDLQRSFNILKFFNAVRNNDSQALIKLSESQKGLINSVDTIWGAPIQFAARYGKIEHIDILLKHGAKLDIKNSSGDLPIHDLIKSQFLNNIEYVIKKSSKYINELNGQGYTPLHLAVLGNQSKIITLLLKYGANVNAKDQYGLTPLKIAQDIEKKEIIELLLKNKAK